MLQLFCLKYVDESGCCCQRSADYSYSKRGVQKRIRQPRRRGRRINIFGVWEPQRRFEYALLLGGLKAPTLVRLLDWQATIAEQHWQQTGQVTVLVLDNASVHRAKIVQQQVERWQQQGLLLFFLPPYSPQMNRIEEEWLHLKRDELAGRVFEDEYELALAIMAGVEARAAQGGYTVERFRFN